jgi:hypothetical protein
MCTTLSLNIRRLILRPSNPESKPTAEEGGVEVGRRRGQRHQALGSLP